MLKALTLTVLFNVELFKYMYLSSLASNCHFAFSLCLWIFSDFPTVHLLGFFLSFLFLVPIALKKGKKDA